METTMTTLLANVPSQQEIFYSSSDGEPLAETYDHLIAITGINSKRDKDPIDSIERPSSSPKTGEGEPEHKAKSLAPSPLVGEGWGEG
jgi:hypothetical protein